MKHVALFLVMLGLIPAGKAMAEPPDVFFGLKINQRIEVILKNDSTFTGQIKIITKDIIILDLSYGDPQLNGTITFYKDEIKKIEVLTPLTEVEKAQLNEAEKRRLKKLRQNVKAAEGKTPAGEETITPTAEAPTEKTDEEKEKERLLALLAKFPPAQGWGDARKTDILEKMELARTDEEKEFLTVYEEWLKGKALKEKDDRRALLEKFPVKDGWGKDKYNEITTRLARIKIGPSALEQEFVNKFADWEKALAEKEAEDKAKEKEKEKEQESPPAPKESPPAPESESPK